MAWIETIDPKEARGPLKEEYDRALERAGKIYNVVKLSSLRPDVLQSWIHLYLVLMHRDGRLSRPQREMIAVAVSAANNCHY